jgi:hypothetical protein
VFYLPRHETNAKARAKQGHIYTTAAHLSCIPQRVILSEGTVQGTLYTRKKQRLRTAQLCGGDSEEMRTSPTKDANQLRTGDQLDNTTEHIPENEAKEGPAKAWNR